MDTKNNGNLSNDNSLNSTVNNMAAKSQETMAAIKREGERYVDEAKEQWNDLKDKAQDKGEELREHANEAYKKADQYARQNPWQVAGIAAAIGAVAALILTSCSRRRD